MEIPYRRIRTDTSHLYFYGVMEIGVALGAWFCLSVMGWSPIQAAMVACLGAGIGMARFMQGIQRRLALKILGKSFAFTKSLQWIQDKKTALKKPSNIYLGEGFVWGQEHVQAFMEVSTLPEKSRYFDQLPPEGGLPYIHGVGKYLDSGSDKPIVLPLPEHTSLHGTTGIGKTRLIELIVSQLIQQKEPVVIIDPKSDSKLLDAVYQACVNIGCADKFEYFSLAHPQVSASLNPFSNYSTPGEIANRITSIMPDTGNSQPFVDFCYDVLATVAEVLILIREPVNLKTLYNYAVLDRPGLLTKATDYRKENRLSPEHRGQLDNAIKELYLKISHDSTHFQKMTTSLLPVMRSLTAGNIGAILSPLHETLSWERIIREKLIVYISLASLKDSYVSMNVGKLIKQDLLSYVGNLYTRQSEFQPIHVFVDELYSVFYKGYVDILNKSRAAGLHLYVGLQTTADIEALTSEAVRKQVFGLLGNKIFMRIPDAEQGEELVKTLGKVMVPKATVTRNVAGSMKGHDLAHGELFRSGYAERLDLVETDLLPVEVLTSLPKGQAILVTQGYPPIKLRIPLLDKETMPHVSFFERIEQLYGSQGT